MKDTIQIAFCTDKNYVMPTGIAMISICANNKTERIHFHIVITIRDDGQEDDIRGVRTSIVSEYNQEVSFYYQKENDLDLYVCRANSNVSSTSFVRILLPEILPVSITKIIYLDGDIVVNRGLYELWNYPMPYGCPLAGVLDRIGNSGAIRESINLPISVPYINAGVLLLDLDVWRKEKLSQLCVDAYLGNRYQYLDQDTLNCVLGSRMCLLPMKYNMQISFWIFGETDWMIDGTKMQEVREGLISPVIIHYASSNKPWKSSYCPMKEIWRKYEKMSLWKCQNRKSTWVYMPYSWMYAQFQQVYYSQYKLLKWTFPIYILPIRLIGKFLNLLKNAK